MSEVLVGDWEERVPACFRVASLSVAAYDWLWTLPTEWEIYREQESVFRLGRGCILFILIRYSSVCALTASNIGFFAHGFSPLACAKYRYFPPSMKIFQSTIAQLILLVRTWAISRHSTWVLVTLSSLFVVAIALESWANMYMLVAVQNAWKNCTSGNHHGQEYAWIHYLMCMVFDGACLGIASGYLWVQSMDTTGVRGLARLLLREGVVYWIVLTTVNVANLLTYHTADLSAQASAASIGYTLVWIMAQRILIQLHNLRTSGSVHTDCASIREFMGTRPHPTPAPMGSMLFKSHDEPKRSLRLASPEVLLSCGADLETGCEQVILNGGEAKCRCGRSEVEDEDGLDVGEYRECMLERADANSRT
ncbi:hypothetical protein CERSUDRAFT_111696 [Gelatoporia subvermispora B]|uniref:DUF6533 domain-containing protein n=1 Tax=Ceriporiopsis subvermispora (strain B) TaxID=914234 RepID=M2PWC3_CERS8|nr:hypothetical protein CERSUDRAFT_111696 [Gelatoporia subvermispora B]